MCSPSLASTVGGDETSPPCLRASTGTDHTTSERARIHTHANVRTRAQELRYTMSTEISSNGVSDCFSHLSQTGKDIY